MKSKKGKEERGDDGRKKLEDKREQTKQRERKKKSTRLRYLLW